MSIKEKITKELKKSMKEGEKDKAGVLRMLVSSLNNAKIEKKEDLEEDDEIEVLKREAKQRKEAIKDYKKGERDDLVEKEEKELEIIEKYLPKQMPEEEIEKVVDKTIEETKAEDMSDMGKVMGAVMEKVKGKTDGSEVKNIVQKKLS